MNLGDLLNEYAAAVRSADWGCPPPAVKAERDARVEKARLAIGLYLAGVGPAALEAGDLEVDRLRALVARAERIEEALRNVADFSPPNGAPGWCWCGEDEFPEDGHFPYCEAARAALSAPRPDDGEREKP